MAVAVRGALVVILAALSVLTGCGASGSSDSAAPPERDPAEVKAWDQLSSILMDLSLLNDRFDRQLELTRDIGISMSVSSMVPYAEYEKLSVRLRVWRKGSSATYPTFWEELASHALDMSDSLVAYAQQGEDHFLARAEDAHERLNATLDEHCEKPAGSLFVEYCK